MAARALFLAFGFALAYFWRETRRAQPDRPVAFDGPLLFLLAIGLALLSVQQGISWANYEQTWWLRHVPLDSMALGVVLGMVFADLPRRLSAGASGGGFSIAAVTQAVGDVLLVGLPLAVLALAALVPPGHWERFFDRVERVEGGKFALTLSSPQVAAGAVRTAATVDGSSRDAINSVGFVATRIALLTELTYPAGFRQSHQGPFRRADPLHSNYDADNLILRHGERVPAFPARGVLYDLDTGPFKSVYGIQRDLAFLHNLHKPNPGSGDRAQPMERLLKGRLQDFAAQQEQFLVRLRPFAGCLATVVEATGDRIVVDYMNYPNVERIASLIQALASVWAELETSDVLPMESTRPPVHNARTSRVRDLQFSLNGAIFAFVGWGADMLRTAPADMLAKVSKEALEGACPIGVSHPPPVEPVVPVGTDMPAPYIALFAAHLLSGIGHHHLAVETLVSWLERFERFRSRRHPASHSHDEIVKTWIQLRVVSHLWTLQRLSEGTDQAIPLRVSLVERRMHLHLLALGSRGLEIWREAEPSKCRGSDNNWLQVLVLSYFHSVKEYLDLLNVQADASGRIRRRHLDLAEMLAQVNTRCFDPEIVLTVPPEDQSAQFTLTYVTTSITWISSESVSREERERLVTTARLRLRDAMRALRAAPPRSEPNIGSDIRFDVYGRPRQATLDAAEALRIRLAALDGS